MVVTLKVDSSIPIPNGMTLTYPFSDMKVGDSFAIPPGVKVSAVRTSASMFIARKGKGLGFSVRKVSARGQPAKYRVWRVS